MPNNTNGGDYMARQCDEELKQLEALIAALYTQATNEVQTEFNKFIQWFAPKNAAMQQELANGNITQADYQLWVKHQLLDTALYMGAIATFTDIMVNADLAAMAIVRGELPVVITQSYNFVQSLGWAEADAAGYSIGTFQIMNADAVQTLIKNNPKVLPYVDKPTDIKWNSDKINNVITQAIMQGDDMETVAEKLKQVIGMDETQAMRAARTAMTYAENLGREESYQDLKRHGIPVRKQWSAIIDGRTRETHKKLNGTFPNSKGLFGAGILNPKHLMKCPADPNGEPKEVYNCRCRLLVVFDNDLVDHSNDDELYEEFMKENDPQSYEALKARGVFNRKGA